LRVLKGQEFVLVPPGKQPIFLEYGVDCKPRWGHGKSSHPQLATIINKNKRLYAETLQRFLAYSADFESIERDHDPDFPSKPHWVNDYLPNLDGISIYAYIAMQTGRLYFEVGSGNSTKFARLSIANNKKNTRIISVDPAPRADVEELCDESIRKSLEDTDLTVFDQLGDGDILFMDNSHRSFMNSDVTVFFTEVLPRLRPGVLVGIHDIFLPDDYPPEWGQRYYSEQYLLASYLLADTNKFQIELPLWMVSRDEELCSVVAPIFSRGALAKKRPHGVACWIRICRP
jgi:hypothetical protein